MKDFKVQIDMTWSQEVNVKAKNKTEAKKLAWEKFSNRLPKKDFSIYAEERDEFDY